MVLTSDRRVACHFVRYDAVCVMNETTSTGFSAYVPDLPGVAVAGDSREQTRDLLRKAVARHLQGGRYIPVCAVVPQASEVIFQAVPDFASTNVQVPSSPTGFPAIVPVKFTFATT